MPPINLIWTDFKAIVNARSLSIQYFEFTTSYSLFLFDGLMCVSCFLTKDGGVNVLDFENNYKASGNGSVKNTVIMSASSAVPTGASTSALQTSGNSSLSSIDGKTPALVSGRQPVDGSGVTQPVSAVSLPLPSGGSTSALQTSGNSSLSSLDTKIPVLGEALAAASTPVVLTAAQIATLTPLSSVTVTQTTGTNLHATIDNFPANQVVSSSDTTATGALGALNAAVQVNTQGQNSIGMQLAAGTFVGTLLPEVSYDSGVTWNSTYFSDPGTGILTGSLVFGSANTATGRSIIGAPGTGLTRVRVSAYTSGTANITVRASTIIPSIMLHEGVPSLPGPPTAVQIGGTVSTAAPTYNNGNLNTLSLTTSGSLRVDSSGSTQPVTPSGLSKATYAAGISGLVSAALATDVFTITGSATKTVKIIEIGMSGSATAAAIGRYSLIKRSAANTSGTSTAQTAVPFDSNNAAGTATVLAYTANPSVGAAVGTVKTIAVLIDSTTIQSNTTIIGPNDLGQPITLRGTAQVLAINLNATTFTGGTFNFYIVWTEE